MKTCCWLLQQLSNLQKAETEIREQKCLCVCEQAETKLEGDSCFSPPPTTEAEKICDYILSEKTGDICHIICLAAAVSSPLSWKRSLFLTQQMRFTVSIAGDCPGRPRMAPLWLCRCSCRCCAMTNALPSPEGAWYLLFPGLKLLQSHPPAAGPSWPLPTSTAHRVPGQRLLAGGGQIRGAPSSAHPGTHCGETACKAFLARPVTLALKRHF